MFKIRNALILTLEDLNFLGNTYYTEWLKIGKSKHALHMEPGWFKGRKVFFFEAHLILFTDAHENVVYILKNRLGGTTGRILTEKKDI